MLKSLKKKTFFKHVFYMCFSCRPYSSYRSKIVFFAITVDVILCSCMQVKSSRVSTLQYSTNNNGKKILVSQKRFSKWDGKIFEFVLNPLNSYSAYGIFCKMFHASLARSCKFSSLTAALSNVHSLESLVVGRYTLRG